jgi:hypothetical protein
LVLVAETADAARFSYLNAMLRSAGIEPAVTDSSVGEYWSRTAAYQLFVTEEDAARAKA